MLEVDRIFGQSLGYLCKYKLGILYRIVVLFYILFNLLIVALINSSTIVTFINASHDS